MCVCARPVVCLPMYGGERGGGNRFYFLFFSRHPLLAFCLEQVEHGSANNVACGFISEKVIEIPRARVGNWEQSGFDRCGRMDGLKSRSKRARRLITNWAGWNEFLYSTASDCDCASLKNGAAGRAILSFWEKWKRFDQPIVTKWRIWNRQPRWPLWVQFLAWLWQIRSIRYQLI